MKLVKNISEQDLSIPDVGVIKAGETGTVPDDFNNPNFEVAKSGKAEAPKAEVNQTKENNK